MVPFYVIKSRGGKEVKDKKRSKKAKGRVIHGETPAERFKEIHGMTLEEWHAKQEEEFKAKTGMTIDEWMLIR